MSRYVILDIKTAADFHKAAYLLQGAAYAPSVPYDPTTGERGEWRIPLAQDEAFIAHIPVGELIKADDDEPGDWPDWTLNSVNLPLGTRVLDELYALKNDERHLTAFTPIAAPTRTAHAVVEQPAGGDVPSPASPPANLEQFYDNQPDDGPTLDAADHQQIVDTIRAHRVDTTLDDQRARFAQMEQQGVIDKTEFLAYCERNDVELTDAEQVCEAITACYNFHAVKVDAPPPTPIAAPKPPPRTPPEEGDEIPPAQVDAMGKAYAALEDASRSWVSVCGASVRLNPASGGVASVRRFEILRGLVALGANGFDNDDTVRAIAALTSIAEDAWRAGVTVPALLALMTVADATRFALVADIVATGDVAMHYTTDGRCVISPSVLEAAA